MPRAEILSEMLHHLTFVASGAVDYGECDYGECEYGGCVRVRVWPMG